MQLVGRYVPTQSFPYITWTLFNLAADEPVDPWHHGHLLPAMIIGYNGLDDCFILQKALHIPYGELDL